jgi:hypothetical protein
MSSQGGKSLYKVDDDNTNDEQNDGAVAPRTSGAELVNRRPATQRADAPTATASRHLRHLRGRAKRGSSLHRQSAAFAARSARMTRDDFVYLAAAASDDDDEADGDDDDE